jgi:multidrug efflux system outer membrane protein
MSKPRQNQADRATGAGRIVFAVLTTLAFAGCMAGPNYKKEDPVTPPAFRHAPATPAASEQSIGDLGWWQVYSDPVLQQLIRTSLTSNLDLRIAVTRVEQARQLAAQARSLYYPSVNVQGTVNRGENQIGGAPAFNNSNTTEGFTALLGAVWEIDLWGRLRRLNEGAKARYLATEEGKNAVRLTLVSNVAQAYFELLELDLELEIARRTATAFEKSYWIFDQRREGGTVSKLETARASAAYAQTAATVPELERLIALKENELSLLLGRPPGLIGRLPLDRQEREPPAIPVGLPASLIARRPDIRATEQQLRAANADVGATIAEYFPKIGLSGFLGHVSEDLSDLTAGSSKTWSVAGNLAGPIFQGGRIRDQVAQARARWEEAKIQHERAVLVALGEVSGALISREKFEAARVELARAVEALTSAVELASDRYVAGRASYYEVLEAQQELFPAENALARTRLNQLLSVVQLYRALGGGWQLEETAAAK